MCTVLIRSQWDQRLFAHGSCTDIDVIGSGDLIDVMFWISPHDVAIGFVEVIILGQSSKQYIGPFSI